MTTRKGPKKTQTKTLRTTQRRLFLVELAAPLDKKSENGLLESAIDSYAEPLLKRHGVDLDAVFHIHPGVRKLNLFIVKGYPFNDEDAALRQFVLEHRAFFFRHGENDEMKANVPYVQALWPKIKQYMAAGDERYWASGELMAKDLKAYGLKPPEWPPREGKKVKAS
jgi:hypothetical protein